jgi:hypothetical protein
MGISILPATGRLLATVAAAALLAGVSLQAGAYGDKGTITLHLGVDYSAAKFIYEYNDPDEGVVTTLEQSFSFDKGCTFNEFGSGAALVDLLPEGNSRAKPGIGPSSIGVFDGPSGVPCYRVSQDKGEALGVKLGSTLKTATLNPNLGFDKIELDIEAKGNVRLRLDIFAYFDNTKTVLRSYYLRTGSQIDGPVSPLGFEADASNRVFNCSAASDSGSDAFSNDNCRWVINDSGEGFAIVPEVGEFSLESGADYGAEESSFRTVIYLADVKGQIGCGDMVEARPFDGAVESCQITLLDYKGQCVEKADYLISFDGQTCSFFTNPGDQIIANALLVFKAESAPTTTDVWKDRDDWLSAQLSLIAFPKAPEPFPIPNCLGLTLDYSGGYGSGPGVIPEVDAAGYGSGSPYDLIGGNLTIEFACAFQRWEVLKTNPNTGLLELFLEEGIQFWSDPQLSRPGAGSFN